MDGGPPRVGSVARIRQLKFPPADWRLTGFEEGQT